MRAAEPIAGKRAAFGWHARHVDGHGIDAVLGALAKADAEAARDIGLLAEGGGEMRDIADMIMSGLHDQADPDGAGPEDTGRDGGWSGHAIRCGPAGDWCQTGPGEDAIRRLAARLRGKSGHGGLGRPSGKAPYGKASSGKTGKI